ncbi:MAG: RimK/LysX family protein [Pirellulaceae bacterium]|nr:RimK/LysX family protein [Pirellulaceae bacterium]
MSRRLNRAPKTNELTSPTRSSEVSLKPLLGWREWVQLPEMDMSFIEAKIDTGARSSSMDADPIGEFVRSKQRWLRFSVFVGADLSMAGQCVEAKLVGYRDVRSSTGHLTHRPVIESSIQIGAYRWPIELTLTNRRSMGFRLLLGRSSIGDRFLVDPTRSYLGGPINDQRRYG